MAGPLVVGWGSQYYDPKRGQREVAELLTMRPFSPVSSAVGRRQRRVRGARVLPPAAGGICTVSQCNEAGSSLDLASIRVESPSSRVARGSSALHNLFLAHSVGDTEDGRRLSCVSWGTNSLSTSTRSGVRRSAVYESAHTQQTPLKMHVETWAGLLRNQGPKIFREVEVVPGCAVAVARPSCPDYSPEPPGRGRIIRNMLGWSQLGKTVRSGVWLFRGALQGENLFSSLAVAGDRERKGSYRTAWAVPCDSSCTCSYAYGQGPAMGPLSGKRCWPLLAGSWRALAPLMKPWCAEGEVPTAANLNLYQGWKSCVGWHCDDEPLFGKCGDAKFIVSVSLLAALQFSEGGVSPVRMMKATCAGLAMVTFLSWMANARTSSFIGRILAGNRNGLTLRSVGLNSMFPPVLCLRQEGWHAVCQRVRRVHQFLLWRMLFLAFLGAFWFLLGVLVHMGSSSLAGLPVVYKTWVTKVCLLLDTPFGRRSVGALPL